MLLFISIVLYIRNMENIPYKGSSDPLKIYMLTYFVQTQYISAMLKLHLHVVKLFLMFLLWSDMLFQNFHFIVIKNMYCFIVHDILSKE